MNRLPILALFVLFVVMLAPQALADETPAGMKCVGKAMVEGREVPIYVPVMAAEPVKAPAVPVTQPAATTPVADEADEEEVVVVQAPPAPPATIIVVQAPPPAPITINNTVTNTNTATATSAPAAAPTSESWFAPGSTKYHTPRVMQEPVRYTSAPVAACPPGVSCNEPFVFAPSVTLVGGNRTLVQQTQVHEHQRRGGWGPAPVREHQRRAPCPPRRRHR